MASMAAQIADALAAGLSAYTFSAPYQHIAAVRRYVPDYEGSQLRELQVSVVPGPIEAEKVSRGQDLFTHEIAVVVAKHVDGTNGDIDQLTFLGEEIVDAIRSGVLDMPTMPVNALYFASTMQVHFDRDSLTDRRVFMGHIAVTYRVPRPHVAAPTGV